MCPTVTTALVFSHVAVANPAGRPIAPPAAWMLAVASLCAAVAWYMHWRWRNGRYFMSRFTTAEREAAKWALFGYVLLPCAIGCTALTAMLAIWCLWWLPANAWFGYLFLMLGAGFVGAGGWTLKEWFWPSKRRTPAWVRNRW